MTKAYVALYLHNTTNANLNHGACEMFQSTVDAIHSIGFGASDCVWIVPGTVAED
jgi:hypothetical protein